MWLEDPAMPTGKSLNPAYALMVAVAVGGAIVAYERYQEGERHLERLNEKGLALERKFLTRTGKSDDDPCQTWLLSPAEATKATSEDLEFRLNGYGRCLDAAIQEFPRQREEVLRQHEELERQLQEQQRHQQLLDCLNPALRYCW